MAMFAAFDALQSFEIKSAGLRRNFTEEIMQWRSLGIKIYKNKFFPGFAPQWHQTHRSAVEKFHAIHFGGSHEAPVQRVSPAMITTAMHGFAAGALGYRACAMPADVAEGAQRACFVAGD